MLKDTMFGDKLMFEDGRYTSVKNDAMMLKN